jgi:hypothetical protein
VKLEHSQRAGRYEKQIAVEAARLSRDTMRQKVQRSFGLTREASLGGTIRKSLPFID